MQEILQYLFSGITSGAIYAVIALGFSMLYNSTDLINFAHGEFVMLGGLALVTLWAGLGLPLLAALLLTVAAVAVVGAAFQRLAIATVRNPHLSGLVIIADVF
jgi:branched-chain amino acid transport system permease protein